MMQDGVRVATGNTCQLLVPFSNRSKAFVDACIRQRNIPPLPALLCGVQTFAIQAKGFGICLFVKHWHFLAAAPAPKHLHIQSVPPETATPATPSAWRAASPSPD